MLSFLYSTRFFGHNYILIPVNIDSYLLIAFLSFPHEIVLEAHNINTKGCYTVDQLLDENIQKWSYIVISGPVQWYTLAPSFCSHLKQSPMCSSGEKRKLLFWLLKRSKAKPLGCTSASLFSCFLSSSVEMCPQRTHSFLAVFRIHNFFLSPYTLLHLKAQVYLSILHSTVTDF